MSIPNTANEKKTFEQKNIQNTNIENPMTLVIFQLNAKIERKTAINIMNNNDTEHPTPDELT